MSKSRGLIPLLTLLALALPAGHAIASAGDPDPTFDGDGKRYLSFGASDTGRALLVQGDGKVLVAGYGGAGRDFKVARLNADGSVDPTFGIATADFGGDDKAYAAALQPDGKVVVAGSKDGYMAVARFTSTGKLDPTFSPGGADGDGKRLLDDGGPGDARAVLVQPDGRIVLVAANGETQLRRLYDNGADDGTTFAPAKFGDSQSNNGAALQRDGRIVVVGSVYRDTSSAMSVARYTVDGKLDDSFSGDGKLELTPGELVAGNAALVQPDGKLLVVGYAGDGADFSVTRLLSGGKPDAAFGRGGTASVDFGGADMPTSAALQRDGKIVMSGTTSIGFFQFAVARLGRDGTPDRTFSGDGRATVQFGAADIAYATAVMKDGRIVAAGNTLVNDNVAIARLQADPPPRPVTPVPTDPADPGDPAPPRCAGRAATIVGTGGADVLRGTRGADVIAGLGGADVIKGLRGDDVICGGSGRDQLVGGRGRDRCLGGAGRDRAVCEIRRSA